MRQIIDHVPELSYNLEKGFVECNVCAEKLGYSADLKDDLTEEKMDRKFRNLKTNLRVHMKTGKHMSIVESMIAKDIQHCREESRNQAVGMRIGRLIYYLSHNARADTDFTLLIYLLKRESKPFSQYG